MALLLNQGDVVLRSYSYTEPSPTHPVIPEMCGVRTENLFNGTKYIYTSISSSERWEYNTSLTGSVYRIPCKPNTTYKLYLTENIDISIWRIRDISTDAVPNAQSATVQITGSYADSVPASKSTIFTTSSNAKYILFQTNESAYADILPVIMLVEGSTTLPHEPYGYKIPFENHGENLCSISTWTNSQSTDTRSHFQLRVLAYMGNTIVSASPYVNTSNPGVYTASITLSETADKLVIKHNGSSRDLIVANVMINGTVGESYTVSMYVETNDPTTMDGIKVRDIMLNSGSTPLPYSPYLNKTTPIYLGEVPTIRRIKKLVLTGEETFVATTASTHYRCRTTLVPKASTQNTTAVLSTHYYASAGARDGTITLTSDGNSVYFTDDTNAITAEAFKSYITTQYANGTPVTVWYVLSEPQTGIVNEPLAKIGDHADELTEISVHNLSAPLYGIGDYKDILNLSTGVLTRKIKKYEFTGQENISQGSENFYTSLPTPGMPYSNMYCTHNVDGACMVNNNGGYIWLKISSWSDYATAGELKAFFQQEYAAGTPVTIWYVLATPETETITVPTGMTGEIEGYLTQISTPTPEHQSIPKWNGKEETGGTYAVTVYTPPEIPTTTGQNKLTVDTTLAPYNVTINGHIKYTYWGKIREDVRSGLAQTKFPVGTILYDNEDATTGRSFQVVGYDKHFDPSLTARGYTHSMTLCQLKLSGPWQFDAQEAFLYVEQEMEPATYRIRIPDGYDDANGGNGRSYLFTTTKTIPVGGQITLSWGSGSPPTSVSTYSSSTSTTALDSSKALTLWDESTEAVFIGTIKYDHNTDDSVFGKLNQIQRVRYGSNNYYQSGLRQLLNTDLAANNWWHPTTIFDRPYANRTTNGYLRSLNEDFINVLATPEITHITNNVFEYPSLDGRTFALNTEYKINTDKVFLLSHTEVGLSSSPNVGTILDYYSTHNTNNDRIKYRIDNGNAYYWWLRTPYPTDASVFRLVSTSGALGGYGAYYYLGVAPAHIIQ